MGLWSIASKLSVGAHFAALIQGAAAVLVDYGAVRGLDFDDGKGALAVVNDIIIIIVVVEP